MKVNAEKRGGKYFITLYGIEYELILPEQTSSEKKPRVKSKK